MGNQFFKTTFFEILIADSDSSQTVFLFEKFLREHCQKLKKLAETSVSLTYISFFKFFFPILKVFLLEYFKTKNNFFERNLNMQSEF